MKKELYLNQEEYELLTRLLSEEGIESKNNLDINEVIMKSKKWMKPGVERCKYYIEMNPGLFK